MELISYEEINIEKSICVSVLGLVTRRENRHHFYAGLD